MSEPANIFALIAPQPATKAGGVPLTAPASPPVGTTAISRFDSQLAAQGASGVAAPAGAGPGQGLVIAADGLPVAPILADADRIDGAAGPVDPVGYLDLPSLLNSQQSLDVASRNPTVAPEETVSQAALASRPGGDTPVTTPTDLQSLRQSPDAGLAGNLQYAARPDTPASTALRPAAPVAPPPEPQTIASITPAATPVLPAQPAPTSTVPSQVARDQIDQSVVAAAAKVAGSSPGQATQRTQRSPAGTGQPVPTGTGATAGSDVERLAADRQLRQTTAPGPQNLAQNAKSPETPEQITIATTIVDRPREFPRETSRARLVPSAPHSVGGATSGQGNANSAGQTIQAPVLTALLAFETGANAGRAAQTPPSLSSPPTGLPAIGGEAFAAESLQPQLGTATPLSMTGTDVLSGQLRAITDTAAKPISRVATEHVAVNIAGAVRGGLRQITIQMRPASLGEVDVDIKISNDGHVRAMVLAERPETLEMLQRDARGLERALQDAGLKTDSGGLSFGLRGDGRGGATPEQQQPTVPLYALPSEESDADLVGAYTPSFADGGRVDIRV